MENIIKDFKKFIDLCSENLWSFGFGLEDNFKLHVDTPANELDHYLNSDYHGTPLWFYFLSFDHSLFDYFQERILLKNDWDYTLLFNVDFIESSQYFISLSPSIAHRTLTPFCPFDVLFQVLKKQETAPSHTPYHFSFPVDSIEKFSKDVYSDFLKNAKIKFNLSSFSHIIDNHYQVGIDTLHAIMATDTLKKTFLEQLSNTKTEDFFNVKINLLFQYPQYCVPDFVEKIHPQQLNLLVTQIISQKKVVDKKILFTLMNKEHLIFAIKTDYFSTEQLSHFITDKNIHYHLLDYKLTPHKNLPVKKHKI